MHSFPVKSRRRRLRGSSSAQIKGRKKKALRRGLSLTCSVEPCVQQTLRAAAASWSCCLLERFTRIPEATALPWEAAAHLKAGETEAGKEGTHIPYNLIVRKEASPFPRLSLFPFSHLSANRRQHTRNTTEEQREIPLHPFSLCQKTPRRDPPKRLRQCEPICTIAA